MKPKTIWKYLLISSIVIIAIGLIALGNFDTDISGDGIPNKPQSTRISDKALQIITIVTFSGMTAVYSWVKIYR